MTYITVEVLQIMEEIRNRPICGAINPHHTTDVLPIVCTKSPDHSGPYHHQEGLMSCFAWMGEGPNYRPPVVDDRYPGQAIKHCRHCSRCKQCGGRLKRWRGWGRWRGHRAGCKLAGVATEV
jgi:hypothetical protein